MKLGIRILFVANILVEIGVAFGLFTVLLAFEGTFDAVLWILFLLLLSVYVPTVIRVNRRRFPRTSVKALIVLFSPILAELAIFLLFLSHPSLYNIPLGIAMILSLHFFTAMLLATILELVQTKRVKVITLPKFVHAGWILLALFCVFLFSASGVVVILSSRDSDGAVGGSLVEITAVVLVWLVLGAGIVFVKFHRAGRTLYAQKGYRPNAAIIVSDGEGQVLLCERADRPGTIQTVQGGIDPGETPEQAATREMQEELGIWPKEFELKASLLGTKRYDWNKDVQKELRSTGYKGQEQYFFLAEVAHSVSFDLDYHHREFRKVWWGTPEQLLRLSWSKKRPGIEAALKGFRLL